HEVEPVALAAERAGDAVRRLEVAPAVARRHVQLLLDCANAVGAGADRSRVVHVRAVVARHPEGRRAVLARAAATGGGEREQKKGGASHFTAFERTAPV